MRCGRSALVAHTQRDRSQVQDRGTCLQDEAERNTRPAGKWTQLLSLLGPNIIVASFWIKTVIYCRINRKYRKKHVLDKIIYYYFYDLWREHHIYVIIAKRIRSLSV